MQHILFVCLGNICRSPTAEGVMRRLATEAGLAVEVASAGTGNWHAGEPPHPPAIAAALQRGYDLRAQRARQVTARDFMRFSHILAMDRRNLADLRALRPDCGTEPRLFLDFAPETGLQEVPDPWYNGEFDRTLDLVEAGCRGLIANLQRPGSPGAARKTTSSD